MFVPPERFELSHLSASDPKSDVSTIPPRGYFVELRVGFEPTYQGFADLDFTHQTPEQLAAVVICLPCCDLVVGLNICFKT